MNFALLFAFLSPLIWAAVNVFDKYLVVHKVKYPLGYSIVAGFFYLVFGVIIAVFLDWSEISWYALMWPALAGGLLGIQLYFYYFVSKKADVSYVLGIYYIYPIIVTLLSFLFLSEVISFIGYAGMGLTVMGVVLMSIRIRKVKFSLSLWMLAAMIVTGAFSEFFVKVATSELSLWHNLAVNTVAMGVVFLPALLFARLRRQFISELRNVHFVFVSEFVTFFAILTLYLAMQGMPATIVASLSATQPVFVVLFERAAHRMFGKMIRDDAFRFKIGAIVFVVLGVVLLTLAT